MSMEVMGTDFYSDASLPDDGQLFHDAVHDMESSFWVLVNICLTLKGPGKNMLRDELDPNK